MLDYPGRTNANTEFFKKEVGKSGLEEEITHKKGYFMSLWGFFFIPHVNDILCISLTYLNITLPKFIMLL